MRLLTFLSLSATLVAGASSAHAQVFLQGSMPMVSSCTGNYYDSGGAGAPHSNSEDSTITFCNPSGGAIALTFSSFDLESCCDNLTFYDGPSSTSPMIGSYTGTAVPPPIASTGTCLTAVFHSDGSVTREGWAATISCGMIDTTSFRHGAMPLYETCEGTYYDSGGAAGQYTNSEMSTTTFCDPAGVGPIAMSFTSFATESCCDHLTAYDGPDTTGTELGMYSGSTSPGIVASTGACLTFAWRSDGSVLGDGWSAAITCGATGGENGAPCVTASSCDSGYCVGGICCSSACDDGSMCNGAETCSGGTCASGTPIDCDDFDPCTTEMCVEGSGCEYERIPGCDFDAGPTPRDAGTIFSDGGTTTRDAGPELRGRRAGRRGGCCAVAGTKHASDRTGFSLTLAVLLLAALRRRVAKGRRPNATRGRR